MKKNVDPQSTIRTFCFIYKVGHLISCQNPEGIDNLFCSVRVDVFSCHEVEEGVELSETGAVGVHDREDSLEVDVSLLVLTDGVAERDEARLELIGVQLASPDAIKGSQSVQIDNTKQN